jgi:hypothetical protein
VASAEKQQKHANTTVMFFHERPAGISAPVWCLDDIKRLLLPYNIGSHKSTDVLCASHSNLDERQQTR